MVRNDGVDARLSRIRKVNETIVAMFNIGKDKKEFPLDITIADIEYETGLTERRILEYASIGEKRGLFIIDPKGNKIRRAVSQL
jgi:hypothetical protein